MLKIEEILEVSEKEKRCVCQELGITLEDFWELRNKVYEFIDQSEHLPKQYDTAMVRSSLLNNKGNLKAAEVFVENYYRIKNVYADTLFDHCVPSSKYFNESLQSTLNVCTRKLTPEYNRVQFFKYTDPDGTVQNMYSYLLNMIMVCELRGHYDFAASTVVVCDLHHLTYKTVLKHSVQSAMIVKDILQCIHLRIQAVHFINGSHIVETFLAVIKNALPDKLKNRLYIHKDMESLHKVVPKECLPKDYGGTDKSLKELQEDWIEAMIELEPFFEKLRKAKSTKKFEFNEAAKQSLGLGVEGTFKKLQID